MRRTLLIVVALGCAVAMPGAQRAAPNGEWRYYAGDAASTKYSPLDQITRANVRTLQLAWRWNSPDNDIVKANPTSRPGAYQDTPLMVNGVLYTETSLGIFVAIDPATGQHALAVRPGDLEGRAAAQSRIHASRRGLLDRRHDEAHHQRHARRASRLDRRGDRQARSGVRRRRPRRRHRRPAVRASASATTRSTRRRSS